MDLEFFDRPDFKKAMVDAQEIFRIHAQETGLDQDPVLREVMDGQTIAQAKGLTRDDLEVLYTFGFNMITSGELQKAEDVFMQLCVIDPLEAKNHYCLGVVRQMNGQWMQAIDDFARFLAMDATNPEGYLRLGECLIAQGEKETAREVFDVAMTQARNGHGPTDAVAQVERAIQTLG